MTVGATAGSRMASDHVERRLAAILAADVVGYSRLMGEDEAGTARAVRVHREAAAPIVASHGGRLVKTMGDGVLLEFPSVVAAVECAIAIQKQMAQRNVDVPEAQRIVYRIGVNLGDVLVDGEDIVGEGVNIAARLEVIAEPGSICISGSAYDQVRGKIAAEFIDLGNKELKNIARPVRVYAIRVDAGGHALAPPLLVGSTKAGPPRLSIVVLPFANIGGDAEQDYFVDGVTESLTTDLSRINGSFVIGRHTAFTYKGKAVDPKQIGHELGVRYVLAGSVQRSGDRMRVNVQIIEAATGSHLWAERFDKPIANLFDMQDEIVARLANALNLQLVAAEARRAEWAPNPDSMDLYFQGKAWLNKGLTPEYLVQSRDFFERALALDLGNIEALLGMALVDTRTVGAYMSDDRALRLTAAETALRALSLAPEHALAHLYMGVVQIYTNRAAQGIAECERALALDRNLASAHAFIGLARLFVGRGQETEAHIHEALRFSPRDASAFAWLMIAGLTKVSLGCDEDGIMWLQRAIETNRNVPLAHFGLAAALAYLGRRNEAQTATKARLVLDPTFSTSRYRVGAFSDNPTYLAQRERLMEGMSKAGVPEG
jgi:TolB-like protein/class 3 adenylate cyclase